MRKLKNNQKGFTLVELITVLVILAILAAILVPALLGYIDKAKNQKIITNANVVYKAAQATASEYYGNPIPTNPGTNDGKSTDKNSYWLPVTNDMGGLTTRGQNLPYIKNCYDLIGGEELPAFYAVAVVGQTKPGIVEYVTYYDVESKKVAYWDYKSKKWKIEKDVPKPNSTTTWKYVLNSYGKSGESFSSYYKSK